MDTETKKKRSVLGWIGLVLGTVAAFFVVGAVLLPPPCASREKARRINCAGNLKQIGLALIIYAGDDVEDGYFPDGTSFQRLNAGRYLENGKVYGCPSAAKPNTFADQSNYVYLGAGLKDTNAQSTLVILAHDRPDAKHPNHKTWVNFLFLDGHVRGDNFTGSVESVCARNGWILPQAGPAPDSK